MLNRISVLLVGIGALAGCASSSMLQISTSGHVGCPPEEILIANEHSGFASRAWQATCRTRTYQCSSVGNMMACTQLQAPAAVAYPSPMTLPMPAQ